MKNFRFDFKKGDFVIVDGKAQMIEKNELIKQAVEKLLRTELNKYPIYKDSNYGMPYHSWIYGQRDRELIKIALTRELSERIPELVDGVRRVYDLEFDFDRRGVRVRLSIATDYSESEEIDVWAAY